MQEPNQETGFQGEQQNTGADLASQDTQNQENTLTDTNTVLVSWTASEYIQHHKPASWYVGLVVAVVFLSGLIFLFTRELVSTIVVLVVGLLFGIFASREPEVRTYQLTPSGLMISDKFYPYDTFKSFSVHDEDAIRSIYIIPMKRFMPGITLYFPPDQEEQIANTLADYLPLEDSDPDMIDRLMNRIRF